MDKNNATLEHTVKPVAFRDEVLDYVCKWIICEIQVSQFHAITLIRTILVELCS